jgi:hypothetical protein
VRILWFKNCEVNYFEFCKLWSSSSFKLVSEKKDFLGKDMMHRYDVDRHVGNAKRMIRGNVILSGLYVVM